MLFTVIIYKTTRIMLYKVVISLLFHMVVELSLYVWYMKIKSWRKYLYLTEDKIKSKDLYNEKLHLLHDYCPLLG
jgi:hypothetical protein